MVNNLKGGRKFAACHSPGSMVVCDAIATVFFSPGDHVLTMLPEEMVADPALTATKPRGSCGFAIQAQTKGLSRHIPLEVTSSRLQALARLAIDVFSGCSPSSDAGGWFITEGCCMPACASFPEAEPDDPIPCDKVLNAPSWFAERLNDPMEYSFIERLRIDPVFGTRVPPPNAMASSARSTVPATASPPTSPGAASSSPKGSPNAPWQQAARGAAG